MRLLDAFLAIVRDWRRVFAQQRTYQRAARQALDSLVCLSRRCLTWIIWTNCGQQRSWSAEYFLHSRWQWEPQQLFQPILKRALVYCPQRLVGVAQDDTKLKKTGLSLVQAFYQRDPMSPPFHVNSMPGLRFLQASLPVPLYRYWQPGAGKRPIRLIVIAPTAYRKSQSRKLYYRDPAYLFTTDLSSSVKQLLQIYFDTASCGGTSG